VFPKEEEDRGWERLGKGRVWDFEIRESGLGKRGKKALSRRMEGGINKRLGGVK